MAKKKRKLELDAFTVFTGIVAALAVAAGLWLGLSALQWTRARQSLQDLDRDWKEAVAYVRAHPALAAPTGAVQTNTRVFDTKPLGDYMDQCVKQVGAPAWQTPPRTNRVGGVRREARAGFKLPGDKLIPLLHALDTLRSRTTIFKFNAKRARGEFANKQGPAEWEGTLSMKAPMRKPAKKKPRQEP